MCVWLGKKPIYRPVSPPSPSPAMTTGGGEDVKSLLLQASFCLHCFSLSPLPPFQSLCRARFVLCRQPPLPMAEQLEEVDIPSGETEIPHLAL